jgi:Mg-chelatase subunit ChlD
MRSGGTDIAQAIITSVNVLEGSSGLKTILLITDGRSTIGSPVEDAVTYAKEKNVVINTLGMATATGGNFLNIESISTLDEPTLTMIANQTGGTYFHAETPQELVFKLEGALETQKSDRTIDLAWWFVFGGFAILVFEWMLSNTKYRSIP